MRRSPRRPGGRGGRPRAGGDRQVAAVDDQLVHRDAAGDPAAAATIRRRRARGGAGYRRRSRRVPWPPRRPGRARTGAMLTRSPAASASERDVERHVSAVATHDRRRRPRRARRRRGRSPAGPDRSATRVPQHAAAVRRVPKTRDEAGGLRRIQGRAVPDQLHRGRLAIVLALARCVQIPRPRGRRRRPPRGTRQVLQWPHPTRCIPVSTFTCTACARAPRPRGAQPIAERRSGSAGARARRPPRPVGTPTARGSGPSIPAVRARDPPRPARRRTGRAPRAPRGRPQPPWPYALALTTAISSASAGARPVTPIAPRSTSTVVGRKRVSVTARLPRARSHRAGGRRRRRRPCRRPCGRRPRAWRSMEVRTRPCGGERLDAAREQAAGRAGQDVAGPRGRGAVEPVGFTRAVPPGSTTTVRVPFTSATARLLGEAPRVRETVHRELTPEEASQLALVGGQDRIGLAIGERRRVGLERVQRVGVDDERRGRGPHHLADERRRGRVPGKARADRDGVGLARSAHDRVDGFGSDRSGVGLGQRQEDGLGERRLDHRQDRRRERDHDSRAARIAAARPTARPRSSRATPRPRRASRSSSCGRRADAVGGPPPRHQVRSAMRWPPSRPGRTRCRRPGSPRELGARQQRGADFAAPNVTVSSARIAAPGTAPVARRPRWGCRPRRPEARGVQHVDRGGPRGIGRAAEARCRRSRRPRRRRARAVAASPRVRADAHGRRSHARAGRASTAPGRLVGEHRDADAGTSEMPRRDESVTAVAPSHRHHNTTAVRAAHEVRQERATAAPARSISAAAVCPPPASRRPGRALLGRQQRFHPRSPPRRTRSRSSSRG